MNKINFKFLISILVVAFSFMACDTDDNDEVTKTNHFLYEGKEYLLGESLFTFLEDSSSSEPFNIGLDLYSSKINPDSNNNISGRKGAIFFGFFSSIKNGLSSGTYTFDFNEGREVNTFNIGVIVIDTGDDLSESQSIISGTVKVSKTR